MHLAVRTDADAFAQLDRLRRDGQTADGEHRSAALCERFFQSAFGESRVVPFTSFESVAPVSGSLRAPDERSTSSDARGITPNPPIPTAGSCPGITPNVAPASSPRPKYRHCPSPPAPPAAVEAVAESLADANAVPDPRAFAFAAIDVFGVSDGLARPGGAYAAIKSDMTSDTSLPRRLPCARGSPVCGSIMRGGVEVSSDVGAVGAEGADSSGADDSGGARDVPVGGNGSSCVVRTGAGVDDRSGRASLAPSRCPSARAHRHPRHPSRHPSQHPSHSVVPFSPSARSNCSNCLGHVRLVQRVVRRIFGRAERPRFSHHAHEKLRPARDDDVRGGPPPQ